MSVINSNRKAEANKKLGIGTGQAINKHDIIDWAKKTETDQGQVKDKTSRNQTENATGSVTLKTGCNDLVMKDFMLKCLTCGMSIRQASSWYRLYYKKNSRAFSSPASCFFLSFEEL